MISDGHGNRSSRGRRKADRELEVQFELMRIIAEQNHEITFEYDAEYDRAALYEVVNGKFTERHVFENYTEYLDEYISDLEPEDARAYKKAFLKCLKKPMHQVLDIRVSFGKKKKEWHRLYLASVDDLDGKITTIAGRFVSVHAEKIANENIKHQAEIDALTGVYNHITFERFSEEKLKNNSENLLFMMIDIDDFKIINDSLGHNVGDLVLSQTGKILFDYIGENGYVGRLGGDEFAFLAWGFNDEDEMKSFCVDLRKALKNIIFDMEYSASMGVAMTNGRNMTFKDIYYEADQAVYIAKYHGKNQIVYYNDVIRAKANNTYEQLDSHANKDLIVNEAERDRIEIDKQSEYIFVINAEYKIIVQANRAARNAILVPENEWLEQSCDNFFGQCNGICENCENKGEQYIISRAKDRVNSTLSKLLGEKDFIIHIVPMKWHGIKTDIIYLIDLDDAKQVTASFKKKEFTTESILQIIEYILNCQGDYVYKDVIKMACDFYNADCGAVIYSNHGAFDKIDVVHKPNAKVMAEILEDSVEAGSIRRFWELVDDDGNIYVNDLDRIKATSPEIYKNLADSRIWNLIGMRIGKKDNPAGVLILINSRQNEEEKKYYQFISAFFADELVRKAAMDELEYKKTFDELTGLYSRDSFADLDESWEAYDNSSLGIFAVDIVGLKYINRELGYDNGNKRLKELAKCVSTIFSGYRIYRYEDDQIAAFCKNIDEEGFNKLVKWCKEMVEELDFTVAVGYCWTTNVNVNLQMQEINELIEKDKLEKQSSMHINKNDNKVISDVRGLLSEGSFLVYLQPKVNIKTGNTVGAEALIRLNDKERGIIGPIHFINLFEKYNIIHEVDLYVLRNVCQFQRDKLEAGEEIVPISVNFSKKTLAYENLIGDVREIMETYELPNGAIQIEITETVGDMDHMLIKEVANSLRMMGFVLAMDDFGTKYSNIAMLVQFQFGIAKIDRSLIKDIEENDKSVVVLRHMTEMIRDLGIECVVEGAETKKQIDILKSLNCDVVQGFYYGKPVDISTFYELFME